MPRPLPALVLLLAGATPVRAQDDAIATKVVYTLDAMRNVSGGVDTGDALFGNLDLELEVALEPLVGWRGARAFLYALANHGDGIGAAVGDVQGVSNVEAPETAKVYEAWIEQDFGEHASVLAGLYDVNAEFDVIPSAELFVHSSHGIGADFGLSGRNGPSIFPVTSLAARGRVRPSERSYAQALVADGVPGDPADPNGTQVVLDRDDGVIVAAEAGWLALPSPELDALVQHGRHELPPQERLYGGFGKLALGAWTYAGGDVEGSGLYALAEKSVYYERHDPVQGLSLFGRAGIADESATPVDAYLGAGAVYRGLLPGRGEDRAGLAVAAARVAAGGRWEVAIELSYRARVTRWLTIQPSVQHVIDPGGTGELDDATVLGVRVVAGW